jgi:rare lipoprotein A (peptidoglycan hydrolase)
LTKEETRIASQYGVGDGYHGRRTASGERFNTYALMAPHKRRRFAVTNKNNGRSVRVRITDRGPFIKGPHRPVSSSSQRNRHGRDRARNRSVAHEAREGDRDDPVLFTVRF